MASYRVYKALYPFTARDATEVSMLPEDFLFVYMKEDGTWPNDSAWMKGREIPHINSLITSVNN